MAQVFNQASYHGGSMKASNVTISTVTDTDGSLSSAFLVQNMRIQFRQQISRIYDLSNVDYTYYVAGKAEGTFSIAHILGPAGMLSKFVADYGDICAPGSFTVNIASNAEGACLGSSGSLQCTGAVIEAVGIAVAANDFMINESIDGIFTGLVMS